MKKCTLKKVAAAALNSFLVMTMISGCGAENAAESTKTISIVPVETETITIQDFDKVITLGGLTAAENTVNVIAKISGMEEILAVNVEVGDKVQKGQVLAQLDNETAEINYSNAKLAYDNAATNYQNALALQEIDAVSQTDLNQLQLAYENAGNTLRQAQMALDYATITAPISGTITVVSATEGSFASAGSPLFEIANVDVLEISTGINETNVSKIQTGQEVLLKINSVSDQWFSGSITEISKVMNSQTKNYPITIAMNNKDDALVAGMYAEIKVAVDHADDAVVIPVKAIVYKEAQPVAFVVQPDGTVKEVQLELGINDGDSYVVTDGLAAGDQIVVKGNSDLVEGDAVIIVAADGVEQTRNQQPDDDTAAEEEDGAPEAEPSADEDSAEEETK